MKLAMGASDEVKRHTLEREGALDVYWTCHRDEGFQLHLLFFFFRRLHTFMITKSRICSAVRY